MGAESLTKLVKMTDAVSRIPKYQKWTLRSRRQGGLVYRLVDQAEYHRHKSRPLFIHQLELEEWQRCQCYLGVLKPWTRIQQLLQRGSLILSESLKFMSSQGTMHIVALLTFVGYTNTAVAALSSSRNFNTGTYKAAETELATKHSWTAEKCQLGRLHSSQTQCWWTQSHSSPLRYHLGLSPDGYTKKWYFLIPLEPAWWYQKV